MQNNVLNLDIDSSAMDQNETEYHREVIRFCGDNFVMQSGFQRAWSFLTARISTLLERELELKQQQISACSVAMEHDRTALANALGGIRKAIELRAWLLDGRGCFEWDDENYQKEFSYALDDIVKAHKPLQKIAQDWTHCPQSATALDAARMDWKKRCEDSETELMTLRRKVTGLEEENGRLKREVV